MRTRRILAVVLVAAFAAPAQAAYPEKPIRFVVPSAPGGSVDVLMRILTQQLSVQMGVAFVVENKPGASFVPGTMDIVKAAPAGHTLGWGKLVSQAINDLISGNIEVMFDNVPSIGPHVKSGRVRGLGVSAPKRAAQFPDLPTIAEAGVPGYETNSWGGVIGPARLSREVISRVYAE